MAALVPSFEFQHVIIWPFMLPILSIGSSIIISMLFHFDVCPFLVINLHLHLLESSNRSFCFARSTFARM